MAPCDLILIDLITYILYRIPNWLNAIATNTPVLLGGNTTIRGSGGTVEIVVSRPTVDTWRSGVQVGPQGTTVSLPVGLALQAFGGDLGGGNVTASVTTFRNVGRLFQPRNPSSSLGSGVFDIILFDENGPIPVTNLSMASRLMFELRRIDSVSMQQNCV